MEILKRAPRLPNGRVPGVAPPELRHRIIRQLSVGEQVQLREALIRRMDADARVRAVLVKLGLDPKRKYKFEGTGEVIEIDRTQANYG